MFAKYRNLKLSLIPLRLGQKRPLEKGWTQYCDRLPTVEEVETWDRGNYGFGLALGPASGLMGLDIDSDDVNVLNSCKPSPVCKRGKKGETRFFKYCPDVLSTKIAGCVDVLARGRHTVLPPSIHPDTGQSYVWVTSNTLENFPISNLPEFTGDDLASMRKVLEPDSQFPAGPGLRSNVWQNAVSRPMLNGTRNSTLTSIVGGLLRCGLHPRDVFEYIQYLNTNKLQPPLEISDLEKIMESIMWREYLRRTKRST